MSRQKKILTGLLVLFSLLFFYQNCSPGFQSQQNSSSTGLGAISPTPVSLCSNGQTQTGYLTSTALSPMTCGPQIVKNCINGQWDRNDVLFSACEQFCKDSLTNQPVASGMTRTSYSLAQGATQAACDAALVTSSCQAASGAFVPPMAANAACTVVAPIPNMPVISSFVASPASITTDQSSILTWTVSNATSLSLSTVGVVTGKNSQTVSPKTTTTYTLTASNGANSITRNITVTVSAPPPATGINSVRLAAIGHSLINTVMPMYIVDLAQKLNKQLTMKVQIINGSALNYQWNNHTDAENNPPYFGDVYDALAQTNPAFDVVVMTERVPLQSTIDYEGSHEFAKRWRDRAIQYNPNARIFMFTTWTGYGFEEYWPGIRTRADWRARTEVDGGIFEKLVTEVNAQISSGPKFNIVPGHRAMMALYDAVQARTINWAPAGPDGINYFFQDDIHLNAIGNYYIACVQFAVIYKSTPVGAAVPANLSSSLTSAQARQLQQMAWDVVSAYPRAGL